MSNYVNAVYVHGRPGEALYFNQLNVYFKRATAADFTKNLVWLDDVSGREDLG